MNCKSARSALIGATALPLILANFAIAGGTSTISAPIVVSERPSDQPIVLMLPRDHGRSVLLNADPHPGRVGQIVGGDDSIDWIPGSPLPYGAHPSQANVLIFVRTHEHVPPIAISPWETLTEEHIDELLRMRPWIRRGESILRDMKQAQSQWLREHGYTGRPRTIVGEGELDVDVASVPVQVGSGVTILSPDGPGASAAMDRAAQRPTPQTLGMNPGSVIRVRGN